MKQSKKTENIRRPQAIRKRPAAIHCKNLELQLQARYDCVSIKIHHPATSERRNAPC